MVVLTTLQNLTDYLKTTKYEITFIRLTIKPVSVNIPGLISNKNITYNKSYEYIDISSSVNGINTFYNANYNSPILLTFKKIKYGDTKYSQPQPYYTINNNNATEISNYIDCSLEINSMQSFKDHLKYNTYDIRFVRLNKFSSLKSIYIQYLINSLNLLNKNVDYFDLDVEEINNFYVKQNNSILTYSNGIRSVSTTYSYDLKSLPALLSFKKEQIVNNFIPCRKISGDSIDVINEFLRASLK
jgi:hypothetical protein